MGAVAALAFSIAALSASAATANPAVEFNDNLRAAGHVETSRLVVQLVAAVGVWRPEGPQGAPLDAAVFGEEGGALSAPGPLIRVAAGTAVSVSLHNRLAYDLTVHGLCDRPGPCRERSVRAGTTVTIFFRLKASGTYTYWAARGTETIETRSAADSQLGGAIVVDPPGAVARDRIFVVSIFTDPDKQDDLSAPFVPTINGRSWPFTERLHYQVGDRVRFRVVDLSFDAHAMHLHGFHFEVEAKGDGTISRGIAPRQRQLAVTERVAPNGTFAMSWTASRPGNCCSIAT